MVCLVDIDDPGVRYEGRIFWDMLRPGVRLAVMGGQGVTTSVIRRVIDAGTDRYLVETRNSRYLLTSGRSPSHDELEMARQLTARKVTDAA